MSGQLGVKGAEPRLNVPIMEGAQNGVHRCAAGILVKRPDQRFRAHPCRCRLAFGIQPAQHRTQRIELAVDGFVKKGAQENSIGRISVNPFQWNDLRNRQNVSFVGQELSAQIGFRAGKWNRASSDGLGRRGRKAWG